MIRKTLFAFFALLAALGCFAQNGAEFIVSQLKDPTSDYVLVAAHRGDWRNFPENSLEAIESAIRMGVDIIELDVRMTRDGVLILNHDRTLDRTTTGKGDVGAITYDSIRKLNLRYGHGVESPYRVATLEQAIALCKDRAVINIDKGFNYDDQIMNLLEKSGTAGQILIKGTASPDAVAKKMAPYKHNMLYMPIVNILKKDGAALFAQYKTGSQQLAYEVVWDKMTPEVEACFKEVLVRRSRLWVNTLWASLCGGEDDDKAYRNPEAVYGWHLANGATIIQTDRPQLLIEYLRAQGRHR